MVISFAIIELVASTMFEKKINNMVMYHIQTFVEFYFLIFVYYRIMRRINSQKMVRLFAVIFLFASMLFYFRDSVYEFNTGQRYIEMILLMFTMFVFLYEMTLYDSALRIRKSPFFWLTAGYLIYFSGTLLLFLLQQRFVDSGFNDYWVVHGIFNIFLNLVLTFVLWTGREKYS